MLQLFLVYLSILVASVSTEATQGILRRSSHSSVITEDWIYIDGGELGYSGNLILVPNVTAAIDLSKDWTNSTLDLIYTSRPFLALNFQVLWWDKVRNTIYCFGGERSATSPALDVTPTPPEAIWSFTPDGNNQGQGMWDEVIGPASNQSFPSGIIRPAAGASVSDNQTAYYLGGFTSWGTSPEAKLPYGAIENSPGLLTFDFNTLTLINSTNVANPQPDNLDQWAAPGSILDVSSSFGNDEFLVSFGGGGPGDYANLEAGGFFNNITIYNKNKQEWYWQKAIGNIPQPRASFCAVGAWDDTNKSFEIFVHGGVLGGSFGPSNAGADQVYILTLPAFQWFLVNYTSTDPRFGHTCHAVESQMILIGGLDPTTTRFEPDPWTQQVGIFDMTALQWKDAYQANASSYKSPGTVIDFYQKNSRYPSPWTSTNVQALFQPPNSSATPQTTLQSSSSTPQQTLSPSAMSAPLHTTISHTATIGIVIGSIAVALFFTTGSIVLFLRHYKKRRLLSTLTVTPEHSVPPAASPYNELSATPTPSELSEYTYSKVELPTSTQKYLQRSELPAMAQNHLHASELQATAWNHLQPYELYSDR